MTWPTESAGRWLEPCGNAGPRGMTVIARKGRNRIPLIGLLHFSFAFCRIAATKRPFLRECDFFHIQARDASFRMGWQHQ